MFPPADSILIYSGIIYGYLNALNETLSVRESRAPPSEFIAYTSALVSTESFVQARAWGSVLVAAPEVGSREWILLSS